MIEPALAKREVRLYRMERRAVRRTDIGNELVMLPYAVVMSDCRAGIGIDQALLVAAEAEFVIDTVLALGNE